MDRDQLRRIAGREKVPLGTVEKDYATSAVLAVLSAYPQPGRMVFKGGTCIRKVYFPSARFSVDLDFSCPDEVSRPVLAKLEETLEGQEAYGLQFMEVIEEERNDNGVRISIKHRETSGHPTSVKLDLSFREEPAVKAELKDVHNPYGYPLPACQVTAMALDEILAEKVRAVIARSAPRDIYDVWFLLTNKVSVRWDLVDKKLKILKRDKSFDPRLFDARLEEQRPAWERDLGPLLGRVPDFDEVKGEIRRLLGRP